MCQRWFTCLSIPQWLQCGGVRLAHGQQRTEFADVGTAGEWQLFHSLSSSQPVSSRPPSGRSIRRDKLVGSSETQQARWRQSNESLTPPYISRRRGCWPSANAVPQNPDAIQLRALPSRDWKALCGYRWSRMYPKVWSLVVSSSSKRPAATGAIARAGS